MEFQQEKGKLPHPAHRLVMWYKQSHRQLPWRNTKEPYRILVSETMLQQTRVETVIPYYHAFLERFPDIQSLATAPVDDVLKQWQGLGYYSRARNLKKAAEKIVECYEGVMPDNLDSLLSLPGVGPYTAGAVASIAFDKRAAAVDGNVLRVIARYCGLDSPIDTPDAKRKITEIVNEWVQKERPSLFTQSVMELGATVCTPRSPKCLSCPLQADCIAFQTGRTDELPKKSPKKKRKMIQVVSFWLEDEQGILLERRPDDGLLAGMWQLPSLEIENQSGSGDDSFTDEALDAELEKLVRIPENRQGPTQCESSQMIEQKLHSYVRVGEEKHIFTHIEWHVHVYRPVGIDLRDAVLLNDKEMRFVPRKQIRNFVLPRVYEKIIGKVLGERVR